MMTPMTITVEEYNSVVNGLNTHSRLTEKYIGSLKKYIAGLEEDKTSLFTTLNEKDRQIEELQKQNSFGQKEFNTLRSNHDYLLGICTSKTKQKYKLMVPEE